MEIISQEDVDWYKSTRQGKILTKNPEIIKALKNLNLGQGLKIMADEWNSMLPPLTSDINKHFEKFNKRFTVRALEAKKGWIFISVPMGTDIRKRGSVNL